MKGNINVYISYIPDNNSENNVVNNFIGKLNSRNINIITYENTGFGSDSILTHEKLSEFDYVIILFTPKYKKAVQYRNYNRYGIITEDLFLKLYNKAIPVILTGSTKESLPPWVKHLQVLDYVNFPKEHMNRLYDQLDKTSEKLDDTYKKRNFISFLKRYYILITIIIMIIIPIIAAIIPSILSIPDPIIRVPRIQYINAEELFNVDNINGEEIVIFENEITSVIRKTNLPFSMVGVMLISVENDIPADDVEVVYTRYATQHYEKYKYANQHDIIEKNGTEGSFSFKSLVKDDKTLAIPFCITQPIDIPKDQLDKDFFNSCRHIVVEYELFMICIKVCYWNIAIR